jgi:hypothetical protein
MNVPVHFSIEEDLEGHSQRDQDDDEETEAMGGKKRIPSPDQLRDYNYAVAGQ